MSRTVHNRCRLKHGLTLAEALVLISVALMLTLIIAPIYIVEKPRIRTHTMSNLKQLTLGMLMYAADNDDHCPPASEWMDAIYPIVRNKDLYLDRTIVDRKEDEYGFASYRPASYVGLDHIANAEVVPYAFQSSDLRWNATGDLSLLPYPPRAKGMNIVSFLDGHAKALPPTWPEKPIEIKFKGPGEK